MSFLTKVEAKYKTGEKFSDIPFKEYAPKDSAFLKEAKRIEKNGTMNEYVKEAINKKVSYKDMVKEIKLAIKKHSEYDKQPGSSHLHAGVVMAMWHLLAALYTSHPEGKNK